MRSTTSARAAAVGLGLAATLLVGACGSSHPTGANQPGGPAYDPAGSPTPTMTATAPSGISSSGPTLSLTGTLNEGAEPGCHILSTKTGSYELLGDLSSMANVDSQSAPQVSVRGILVTGMMSHCMQGKPLKVISIKLGSDPIAP